MDPAGEDNFNRHLGIPVDFWPNCMKHPPGHSHGLPTCFVSGMEEAYERLMLHTRSFLFNLSVPTIFRYSILEHRSWRNSIPSLTDRHLVIRTE